ncbi:carbohydrate kinase [Pseudaminobacter arsenicus]|uniref:Carbohydrate kinase n=1 Tax=Borborobacter arsenicus TaxID=1851146 RepID=A0A432VCH4_9HYPH|nr:carbohydrate kinase family protein [Pseudaminobacter arsenicus]RUM99859.1 carbohydrate kinase [Pseudaminobacter arsenicus]
MRRIACIGGAVLDRKYHARKALVFGTSNPVEGGRGFGGVARNVAENLARLGVPASFASIVGDDEDGRALIRHLAELGVDVSPVITTGAHPTAEYAAILGPDNDLVLGIADMGIFDRFGPEQLDRIWPHIASASWVFADCNLPEATLAALVARRQAGRFRLAIDAVSSPKVLRLPTDLTGIDLLFLNNDEGNALLGRNGPSGQFVPKETASRLRQCGAAEVVVTMGADGIVLASDKGVVKVESVPAHPVDVTGAGDAMIAGTLCRIVAGEDSSTAVRTGALAASLTIESEASVRPDLSVQLLAANMHRLPA